MGRATYIQSPCVMICTLDENDICVGCLRSLEEIGRWPDADMDERIEILDKITVRCKSIADNERY